VEGLKAAKGLLRHDFQANIWPRLFLKPMSPQETGRRFLGNPGFELRMFEHCEGRGGPLLNKKGF
jgi:hypothetical protein